MTEKNTLLESSLLRVMAIKENYNKYHDVLDLSRLLIPTQLLLKDYEKYFNIYKEAVEIDWGKFHTHFSQEWHRRDLDNNEVEYYRDVVYGIIQNAKEDEVENILQGLRQAEFEQKIKETLDPIELKEIIEQYEKETHVVNDEVDGYTIETVDFSVLDKSVGIPYFLPTLQAQLGSLVAGQLVVVAADSGVGKSAFVISQLVHTFKMLSRQGKQENILYFNSEGTSADVIDRFLSNLYRKQYQEGFEEIVDNQQEVISLFKQQYKDTYGKLWVFPISKIDSFRKVKAKVQKYKPALVIIDICDKLSPEEDVTNLKKLYDDLRVLAGDVCPIIGTSQAGNQEYYDKENNKFETRKWLTDKAMYGSKSGKQGAADTIIVIGKDASDNGMRYVNVVKNKRGKACKVTCVLEEKYSRYEELSW